MRPLEELDWLSGEGPESQVALATRVRLARNLARYPFPTVRAAEPLQGVLEEVRPVLGQLESVEFMDMAGVNLLAAHLLVERHLISPPFCQSYLPRGLGLTPDGRLSVMVNEEDHLRIQVLCSGLQFERAFRTASQIDDRLDEQLEFAFDPQFGYLTSCPSNLGTGLRASVMLHLPAMAYFNALEQVLAQVAQVGLAVRGLYGEGTHPAGNLLQISNQVSLGPSEDDILAKVKGVAMHLVNSELAARRELMTRARLQLEDRVWRAFGLLKSARLMVSNEAMEHLSTLRLGVDLGLLPSLDVPTLNRLLVRIRPANLQHEAERELAPVERDQMRASLLRDTLS